MVDGIHRFMYKPTIEAPWCDNRGHCATRPAMPRRFARNALVIFAVIDL